MTQLPNQLLKSSIPLVVPVNKSANYSNHPPLSQYVPTQQNTPLTQSMSMNGLQKSQNGKDTSKL
jgi:hypothetical protein